MTDTLGVPAGAAGLVVALPKAWDVFFNPFVGAASDREAVRTGRRTKLLMMGGVALPAAFAAMFLSPATKSGAVLWVTVAFVLAASAFSLFQVPYVALPTEMASGPGRTHPDHGLAHRLPDDLGSWSPAAWPRRW